MPEANDGLNRFIDHLTKAVDDFHAALRDLDDKVDNRHLDMINAVSVLRGELETFKDTKFHPLDKLVARLMVRASLFGTLAVAGAAIGGFVAQLLFG